MQKIAEDLKLWVVFSSQSYFPKMTLRSAVLIMVTTCRWVTHWEVSTMVHSFPEVPQQTRNCTPLCSLPSRTLLVLHSQHTPWVFGIGQSPFSYRLRKKHQLSKINSDLPIQRRMCQSQIWKGGLHGNCDDH